MVGPGAFRLFLAFMVLVSHATSARFGIVAVMAFFILSGYWVTRMYAEKYARAASPVPTFYLSRFLRLWPAYVVALAIAVLVRVLRSETVGWNIAQSLGLFGIASGLPDPLQVSWSLDIEMQFYLILPFLLLLMTRLARPMPQIATILVLTALGWGLAGALHLNTALMYLPTFGAGMLLYLRNLRAPGSLALASFALFVGLGLLFVMNHHTYPIVMQAPMHRKLQRALSLGWGLALIPFVAWNVRQASGWLDRHMGDFSYSLYLVHFPALQLLAHLGGEPDTLAATILYMLLALAAALVFYLVVDRTSERARLAVMSRWSSAQA